MTDNINEVRERISAAAELYAGLLHSPSMAPDLRILLADHARLQVAHADALKAMRQAVIALSHAQESDPAYQNAYGALDAAIDAAKADAEPPHLCDLCRVRKAVRSDDEGIPFCQECWDGWEATHD